jgi:hypothetical protein
MLDLSVFAMHWMEHNCDFDNDYCQGTDFDLSGAVDQCDFAIFADNWPTWTRPYTDPYVLWETALIALWRLDTIGGSVATDSIGFKKGTLHGDPMWQPTGGKFGGALEFDGINDYVSTGVILDPTDDRFSTFVWIKTNSADRTIISQLGTHGASWLAIDGAGRLITEFQGSSGRGPIPLPPGTVITDGQWHRVGLTWDGAHRTLYVDDVQVAGDTSAQSIRSADGGLNIGASKDLSNDSFFSGLIDDVRIYDRAIEP